MFLLDLPDVMIEHVFSFLTYDEVAKYRIVCKDFNVICQRLLNRGFVMIERRQSHSLKAIKALLPRRESERRCHTFSRHCDILTSMETRLSMLSMTYTKFIEHNVCCFIPGKVIDEIRRVLTIVEKSETLPRTHEVLEELRDISSMAIEHFDDKVSPALRAKMQLACRVGIANNGFQNVPSTFDAGGLVSAHSPTQLLMNEMKMRCARSQRSTLQISRKMGKILNKLRWYKRQVVAQNRIIKDISEKQAEQECNMAELKKRIEECDVKYQELNSQGGKGIKDMASSSGMCGPTATSQQHEAALQQVHGQQKHTGEATKHFSSQIRLDPSLLAIGVRRRGRASPNIKPRRSSIEPPSRDVSSQISASPSLISRPKRRRLLHDQPSCSDGRIQSNITHSFYKNISSVLSDLLGNENADGKRKKPRYQIDNNKPCTIISNTSAYRPEVDIRDCDSNKSTFAQIQSDNDSLVRKFFTEIFESNRAANAGETEERHESMNCDAQINVEVDGRKNFKRNEKEETVKASKSSVDDSNASNLRDRMNVVVNRVFDALGKNNTLKDVTVSDVTQEVELVPCTSGSSNFDGKEMPPPDELDNLICVMQNVDPRETEKITELIAVAKKVLWGTGDGTKQKDSDPKCSKKK